MEFYAAMKKNEMLSFTGKWMELENIILSEVSLAQKTKDHHIFLTKNHLGYFSSSLSHRESKG
jgi:hypothetical protein